MQSFASNPAIKSQVETQLNLMTDLSLKTFDAARKLSELNMQAARQAVEDWVSLNRALLQCSDPFQMASTAMKGVQHAAEHMRSYQQQLMGLWAGARSDLARSAEAIMPEASRSVRAMADQMVRNASASASAAGNLGAARNPT